MVAHHEEEQTCCKEYEKASNAKPASIPHLLCIYLLILMEFYYREERQLCSGITKKLVKQK